MSMNLASCSPAGAPTPTPALLHVQAAEARSVTRDDAGDRLGVRQVPGDGLDFAPAVAQPFRRRLQRGAVAGADGQPVVLGREDLREGEPDATLAPVTIAARSGTSETLVRRRRARALRRKEERS